MERTNRKSGIWLMMSWCYFTTCAICVMSIAFVPFAASCRSKKSDWGKLVHSFREVERDIGTLMTNDNDDSIPLQSNGMRLVRREDALVVLDTYRIHSCFVLRSSLHGGFIDASCPDSLAIRLNDGRYRFVFDFNIKGLSEACFSKSEEYVRLK